MNRSPRVGRKQQAHQQSTSISDARRLFPGAEKWVYMDVAARGLLSTRVKAAVDNYLDVRMTNGGNKKWMLGIVEEVRKCFAELINAEDDEVAFTFVLFVERSMPSPLPSSSGEFRSIRM